MTTYNFRIYGLLAVSDVRLTSCSAVFSKKIRMRESILGTFILEDKDEIRKR